ncbi:hypothetical protein P7K49_000089 [Saguinus oedipus]|uniref:Uncharacterized protein n=1 Tax=Saguinus oedipus TaxID=9490 RepID=A0ABQ9WD46_SAGOE|nr:hypothetical protein P7K49_000089 [Saguinus oedipus]
MFAKRIQKMQMTEIHAFPSAEKAACGPEDRFLVVSASHDAHPNCGVGVHWRLLPESCLNLRNWYFTSYDDD